MARLLPLAALLLLAHAASARDVALAPALFSVPDAWTPSLVDENSATFTAPNGYVVVVADAPTIHSRADVDKALAESAAGLAAKSGLREIATGDTDVSENAHGVEFTGARTAAESDRGPMVFVAQFAKMTPGRYVFVMTAGSAAADEAEAANYTALLDSLRVPGL